jgi:hypothetical protein
MESTTNSKATMLPEKKNETDSAYNLGIFSDLNNFSNTRLAQIA